MSDIKKITIVGAGLIGSGWSTHLLNKGVTDITMYDISDDALAAGRPHLDRNMNFMIENGIFTKEQAAELVSKIKFTCDMKEAVKDADLIIENGPEKLEIKQAIIANIEEYCKDDAIITSSTSGIMIGRIVVNAKHPERILGAHPYHPVYLLPLLEVVKHDRLDAKCLDKALDFYKGVDKKPVVMQKDSPGYIGSRLMLALFREAVNIVKEGVTDPEGVDTAFVFGPGLRYALMGPFLVYQLTGGNNGITGLFNSPLGDSVKGWMSALAKWDEWPEDIDKYLKKDVQADVDKEMANRKPGQGRTNAELLNFRDEGLVQILKHHELL